MKLEPFTVRPNAALPACAEDGFRLLITAAETVARIVNAELPLAAPFVFTVTDAVPCAAMRLASTIPVN